jgi:hypothetical protein
MSETTLLSKGSKDSAMMADLASYFADILKSAPDYGWCGMTITFHDGHPVKIEKSVSVSIKPGDKGK